MSPWCGEPIVVYEIRAIIECPNTRWEITPSDHVWSKVGKNLYDAFEGEKRFYIKDEPIDITYNNPFSNKL